MKWEFMHQTTLDSAAVKTSVQQKFESGAGAVGVRGFFTRTG